MQTKTIKLKIMAKTYKYRNIKSSISHLSTGELVEQFNSLVGKRCWASARAVHDTAIIDTLMKRGVDVSAVYDGVSISFREHAILNEDLNKLYLM